MALLTSILPALQNAHGYGYWIIFAASLLESLAFVGIFIPGTVVVAVAGFAAAQGYLDATTAIWFAALGAILGDAISFSLGSKGTQLFKQENRILKAAHLAQGERFLKKHGSKSVFLGRFLGPIRPIIPFVAGMFKMRPREFYTWNIASAFGWSALYVLLGYFFGQAWQTVAVWSTRIGIFIACIVVVIGIVYVLKQFVVQHGKRGFILLTSLLQSIWSAIKSNPQVQEFAKNHTAFIRFIRARLTRKKFSGLPATLLIISFAYTLFLFFGLVEDFLRYDPIIAIDTRFANLLFEFRDPAFVSIFLWITAIGNFFTVLLLSLFLSIAFWVWKKRHLILPLWLAILGSQAITFIGKLSLHRPRPSSLIPVYTESSYSFPSGHATAAVALYGFIAYCIWRNTPKWAYRINALFVAIGIILSIGFSRLYLGVHFLSDVVSGYLVGLLWLIISISILEWQRYQKINAPVRITKKTKLAGYGVIVTAGILAIAYAFSYNPPKHSIAPEPIVSLSPVPLQNIGSYFDTAHLPKFTETLAGNPQEPIGFALAAPNDIALIRALQQAGWYLADPVSFESIANISRAALLHTPYNTAPITPSFWNAQVHTFGFEKSTAEHVVTKRHHARIWKTDIRTEDGLTLYVGTASFDTSLKWLVTHKIQPDIDTEKTTLMTDLTNAGVVKTIHQETFVEPTLGKNFSGDEFFTDGRVYIVQLQ